MTAPRPGDGSLSPVRRRADAPPTPARRGGQPSDQEPFTGSEIARGQSDAVLGALGRMQLRLDVLSREQADALASISALLEHVVARLDQLDNAEQDRPDY